MSADLDQTDQVDFSRLTRVAGRGIHAAEARVAAPIKATYAVVDDRHLTVSLADGRTVAAPLSWYPRLEHATPMERNDWKIIMGGRAFSWRRLGTAISVKALLAGEKSDEPAASLRKWMAQRRTTEGKRKAG